MTLDICQFSGISISHSIPEGFSLIDALKFSFLSVQSLTDEEIKLSKNYRNELCKIDNYYLLLSCIDSGAEVYNDLENFTVYNISLESDNLDENFGIFSNGMLIESCGINYLKKYMQLKV